MAKKFGKVSVSEETDELETEAASARAPDAPGGAPPKKVARATSPGSGRDGSGRFVGDFGGTRGAGFVTRIAQFLRDTRAEMRRVSWPTAKDVKNTTIITLIAVVFFAVYLFLIDRVWAYLIEHLRTFLGG